MKTLLYFLLAISLFTACEKENNEVSISKTYQWTKSDYYIGFDSDTMLFFPENNNKYGHRMLDNLENTKILTPDEIQSSGFYLISFKEQIITDLLNDSITYFSINDNQILVNHTALHIYYKSEKELILYSFVNKTNTTNPNAEPIFLLIKSTYN